MTIIQGNLDLVSMMTADNKEINELINLINSEIEQMASVLNDLTILTVADSANMKVNYEKINIKQLLVGVIKSLKILADKKNINVKLKRIGSDRNMMGDETKIERMFLNLLRNAIKYNNNGGLINIIIEFAAEEVLVSIKDNGIGIPAEDLPFIFDRFYRVDKSRTRQEGGTGLGLAICKWVANIHWGKITVESSLEKGSKFTVNLPYDYKKRLV
jgi:signal transduction histidine kinase